MNMIQDRINQAEDVIQSKISAIEGSYSEAIENLKKEKNRIEKEIRRETRNARRFVRSNPEKSIGYTFLGGIVMGLLISRTIR